MKRRNLLMGGTAIAVLGAAGFGWQTRNQGVATAAEGDFEISLTEAEWRDRLTEEEFSILREHNTERAYTSDLNDEKRPGTYTCAGCDLPLYDAATKYDSGTGWPSFYEPLNNAIGTMEDNTLFATRTEVHCRRCGGHLGHVFDDGPQPTGLRYCMNGIALDFVPETA